MEVWLRSERLVHIGSEEQRYWSIVVRMLNRFRWLTNRSMLNMLRMKRDWELAGLKARLFRLSASFLLMFMKVNMRIS